MTDDVIHGSILLLALLGLSCLGGIWLRVVGASRGDRTKTGPPTLFFRAGPGWIDSEGGRYGRERAALDAGRRALVGVSHAVAVKPTAALGAAAFVVPDDPKAGLFFRPGPGVPAGEENPRRRRHAALIGRRGASAMHAPSAGRNAATLSTTQEPQAFVRRSAAAARDADAERGAAPVPARDAGPAPSAGATARAADAAEAQAHADAGAEGAPSSGTAPTTNGAVATPPPPAGASRAETTAARPTQPADAAVSAGDAPAGTSGAPTGPAGPDTTDVSSAAPSPSGTAPEPATPQPHPGDRPPSLPTARDGQPDNLTLVKGIGPKTERSCNALGVFHLGQIADWSPQHAVWVGNHLACPGRIEREHWVDQAKVLLVGLETAHAAAVRSGATTLDERADTPLSDADAAAVRADLPELAPSVAGEGRHQGARPFGLATAYGGAADDLKRIKGIGKQNEARLNALGIWHFEQIGVWSDENVRWVGSYLAFPGRVTRELWIAQAQRLAAGRPAPFAARIEPQPAATSDGEGENLARTT